MRRTLKQSHGQTIAPALLAKPMAGKVLSYRYLLPVGSNSEETAADPSERPGDGEEFDKTDAAYDPEFLDNPELRSGKHRTIINLTSYVVLPATPSKPAILITVGLNQSLYQGRLSQERDQ